MSKICLKEICCQVLYQNDKPISTNPFGHETTFSLKKHLSKCITLAPKGMGF